MNTTCRTALAAVIGVALTLGLAAPSQAATMGIKWDRRTFYVYVDANVSASWYLTQNIAQWSAAPGVTVYRTTDASKANIRVHQKDLPAPNAAQTAVYFASGTIVGADVTLDVTALSGSYCSRRHIVTHELGHALGLAHNTASKTSLMYVGAGGTCSVVPSAYDLRDLKTMYP